MNKIVNGVANDYEFPFLEKTTENYYQVMNRYYTEEFVKQLQQELQRKDNIINNTEKYIKSFDAKIITQRELCILNDIMLIITNHEDMVDRLKETENE